MLTESGTTAALLLVLDRGYEAGSDSIVAGRDGGFIQEEGLEISLRLLVNRLDLGHDKTTGVLLNLFKSGLLLQELVLGEVGELVDMLEPVGLAVEILLVLLLHLGLGILQGLLPLGLLRGIGDWVQAKLRLELVLIEAVLRVEITKILVVHLNRVQHPQLRSQTQSGIAS